MRKLNLVRGIAVLLLAATTGPAALSALEPDELGVTHLLGVEDRVTIELTMEIAAAAGTRERTVEVFLSRDNRGQRVFARIVDPPFLSRTRYLSVDRGNNRSVRYLANSQGVRRIADSNSDERIFGSDFTVGDFAFVPTDDAVVRELDAPEPGMQRFEIRPADGSAIRVIDYDRARDLIVAASYRAAGRETRRYRVEEIATAGGLSYPRRASMVTLAADSETRIVIHRFDTEAPIPARLFNRAALE